MELVLAQKTDIPPGLTVSDLPFRSVQDDGLDELFRSLPVPSVILWYNLNPKRRMCISQTACAISEITFQSESPWSELLSVKDIWENFPRILQAVGMRDAAGL